MYQVKRVISRVFKPLMYREREKRKEIKRERKKILKKFIGERERRGVRRKRKKEER